MLELKSPEGFRIVIPEISMDTNTIITGKVDDIFAQAQGLRPEIKSAELNLSASELDLKIAIGGRSPRLLNESFRGHNVFQHQKKGNWY